MDGNAYSAVIEAANVAGPGDTVLIRAGTYRASVGLDHQDVLWPKHSGTPTNPVVFKPYNGEQVIVGDLNAAWPNDNWASIARGIISMRNVSYIEIEGLTFKNVSGWLYARNCDHITIRTATGAPNQEHGLLSVIIGKSYITLSVMLLDLSLVEVEIVYCF